MKIRKAVIPAAGLGTRFLPATKAMPKEMLPIVDKPIIQYVVEEAVAAGIEDIIIITGRGKRAIEDHFDRSVELENHLLSGSRTDMFEQVRSIADMVNVHFIRQKEALGLGHAVLQARYHIGDEPFAVLLGDEIFCGDKPCLSELMEQSEATGGSTVVAVRAVEIEQVSQYGVVDPVTVGSGLHRIKGMVEKPLPSSAPSNLAIVGRYIITPAVFRILEQTEPGRGGEIQLTDALSALAADEPAYAYEVSSPRYDVGNKLGYLEATLEVALARPDLAASVRDLVRAVYERTLSWSK